MPPVIQTPKETRSHLTTGKSLVRHFSASPYLIAWIHGSVHSFAQATPLDVEVKAHLSLYACTGDLESSKCDKISPGLDSDSIKWKSSRPRFCKDNGSCWKVWEEGQLDIVKSQVQFSWLTVSQSNHKSPVQVYLLFLRYHLDPTQPD